MVSLTIWCINESSTHVIRTNSSCYLVRGGHGVADSQQLAHVRLSLKKTSLVQLQSHTLQIIYELTQFNSIFREYIHLKSNLKWRVLYSSLLFQVKVFYYRLMILVVCISIFKKHSFFCFYSQGRCTSANFAVRRCWNHLGRRIKDTREATSQTQNLSNKAEIWQFADLTTETRLVKT